MSAELLIKLPDYFPSLINAMQDGFVLRGTDGTIIEVNSAFCDLVGRDRSEIVGARPPHVWWPEDLNDRFTDIFKRYLSGATREDELTYLRANGEQFPALVTNAPLLDSEGNTIAFIGTVKDISERVKAEDQIRFQAALIDQVQAGVIATDNQGQVTFWNRGAEALYGWREDEVIGKPGMDILIAPGSDGIAAGLVESLNTDRAWEGEIAIQRRSGETVPVLISSSVVVGQTGRPVGIVGVAVDISERKHAEARLATQYEVARALSEAQTLAEGLRATLAAIATNLDWQYGAFWTINERLGTAACAETWHADGVDGATFDGICNSKRFERGSGLPGIAWASGKPEWIRDYQAEDHLPRHAGFLALGVGAAFALPVRVAGQVVGIIEFLSNDTREPDHQLLATAESISSQIGQFIERMRAENAVRESENRFWTMANSAPVMLWVADEHGQRTWFNHGWVAYTGRSIEQETGDGWLEGVHHADIAACRLTFRTAVTDQTPYEMEYRLRRHDGEYCWQFERGIPRLEPGGTFVGFIGSAIDISERKRYEEDQAFLSEATRVLSSSLDYRETLTSVANLAVPTIADWCVVHVIDDDGEIRQLAVTHVDPEKARWAKELQERFPPRSDATTGVSNVIRTGEPMLMSHISDEQLVQSARDATHLELLREVGLSSAMILPIIARGKALGAITFVSAERGRHYTASDLELAQHLARRSAVAIDNALLYREAQEAARARDQFLAVAAHELRSPLTSMKGFAQLLLRRAKRLPGGAEWITPLQTIDAQINRVTELVGRLLDVSRIEEKRLQLQVEPVDMVDVVRSAAVEAQLATEHHTVVARFAGDSLVATVDRTRIAQVLANLLDNAIRYSPVDTTVEVILDVDGDDLVVSVHDQGPGIPLEARERMFERYFRGTSSTRAASEGLGLGLYVAHGIVDAHGGRMWVDSDVGQGSTFCFSLPVAPNDTAMALQAATGAVNG